MNDISAQISRYFEEDRQSGRLAVTAKDIPVSYEAMTPQWLTATLCSGHPGAEVLAYSLGEPDDGSANRRRVFLTYNDAGDRVGLPQTIFCKAAHSLRNRLMLGIYGSLHAETTFYNKIAPMMDVSVPESLFASCDLARGTYIILLKDLAGRAEFCDHHTRIDRAKVEDQVCLLARIHGQFHEYPGLTGAEFNLLTFPAFWDNVVSYGLEEYSNKGFLSAEAVIPPRLFRKYDRVWPAAVAAVDRQRVLPHTLMHGDVHLKNWYINADGTMGLSDWQATASGHWGRDLAYTITTALAVEDRRAWERELLALYLDRLRASGGPSVSFDEGWTLYRQQLMSALIYWTVTLTPAPGQPDMQPEDITLEFIRRLACAIDDLDSIESFE